MTLVSTSPFLETLYKCFYIITPPPSTTPPPPTTPHPPTTSPPPTTPHPPTIPHPPTTPPPPTPLSLPTSPVDLVINVTCLKCPDMQ